jgi:hypothetical protein
MGHSVRSMATIVNQGGRRYVRGAWRDPLAQIDVGQGDAKHLVEIMNNCDRPGAPRLAVGR